MPGIQALPDRGSLRSSSLSVSRPAAYICDHETRAPAGQVLQMDKQPFLLRQIESRKKAESDARRKTSDQEKAKAVAKAAKRPGGSLDAPEPKRSAAEDSGQKWSVQKLRAKTKAELVAELELLKTRHQKKVSVSGNKDDLIKRILELQ